MNTRGTLVALCTALLVGSTAGCSAQADENTSATSQTTAEPESTEPRLEGHDLEIAEANCRAYESATEPTRDFHESVAAGGVRETISNWMAVYETAQAGLKLAPVPTAPELTQALEAVSVAYDAALEKLDHYTATTDMSDEIASWNSADEDVRRLCLQLVS